MRRLAALLLIPALLGSGCGDDDDATEGATATTATTEPTTTAAFEGSRDAREGTATTDGVALLTAVQVAPDRVTFTFREGTPGYRITYVDPPITEDGSGEEVEVEGGAHLSVRFEPGSGVDLSGAEFEETYTGPDRIAGEDPVTEVVRTGDFEAVLNWVIGLDSERAYRVEVDGSSVTIVIDSR